MAENRDEGDDRRFAIMHMNLLMRINAEGILLSQINDADRHDLGNNDVDPDSSGHEIIQIPHVGVGMRFTANRISIDRLNQFNDRENNEDDDGNEINMEVDGDAWCSALPKSKIKIQQKSKNNGQCIN